FLGLFICLQPVPVYNNDKIVELKGACQHTGLPVGSLVELAIAQYYRHFVALAPYFTVKSDAGCDRKQVTKRTCMEVYSRDVFIGVPINIVAGGEVQREPFFRDNADLCKCAVKRRDGMPF